MQSGKSGVTGPAAYTTMFADQKKDPVTAVMEGIMIISDDCTIYLGSKNGNGSSVGKIRMKIFEVVPVGE
jgi:hypothetical protein